MYEEGDAEDLIRTLAEQGWTVNAAREYLESNKTDTPTERVPKAFRESFGQEYPFILRKPWADMPLYINHEHRWVRTIVQWRLKIGR